MSKVYRKKSVDKNQAEIVGWLREIPGVTVQLDMDDILVGYKGANYWFEIKTPNRILKSGKPDSSGNQETNKKQKKLSEEWKGHYKIVWSLKQILDDIGISS